MPEQISNMVSRRVQTIVRDRMTDEPVILLEGPRSVGKSTLLRELAAIYDAEVLDLTIQIPGMRSLRILGPSWRTVTRPSTSTSRSTPTDAIG